MTMSKTNAPSRNAVGRIAVAVAIALAAAGTAAFARPPGGMLLGPDRVEARLERMTEHLDLTEAQQVDIRAILEAHAQTVERDRAALRGEIDAVLSDEQRARRDEQMQQRMERRLGRLADRLELTDTQRAVLQNR
jgi:Spy/CpxP family protein refolding chaperone